MTKYNFSIWLLFLFISDSFSQPDISTRLSEEINQSLKNDSFIKTLIFLKDQFDVLSLDQELYNQKVTPEERAKRVIESLQGKSKTSQSELLKYLKSYSVNEVKNINPFWIVNMIALEAKSEVLIKLLENKNIAKMDIDGQLILDVAKKEEKIISKTPGAAEPGLRVINAHRLWQLGYTGAGRIVMNIDTGVDGLHPALGWRWRGNHVADSLAWFDPVFGTTFPNDGDNHGTATMGISCGLDSLTNDTIGVAFGAEWIASNSLWGSPHTSYTIASFQWAMDPDGNPNTIDDMPDAINCSWWDPAVGFCDTIYANVFNAVEAAGIAIVFNAGGGGPSSSSILMPANINTNEVNTWATGVIDGHTSGYPIYAPSGRGPSQCTTGIPSLDIKPEGCAPGVNIRTSITNNAYHIYSGSSMATAHVTGAIALLKEAFPYLTGHEIKMALYNTALDLGAPGEDNIYGMGLIDVWAAYLSLADSGISVSVNPDTLNFGTLFTCYTETLSFDIINSGILEFNVNDIRLTDTIFSIISQLSFSVQPGDTHQVFVKFPSQVPINGNFSDTLIISYDVIGNEDSVYLLGNIIDPPVTCLQPSDTLINKVMNWNQTIDSSSFWLINNFCWQEDYYLEIGTNPFFSKPVQKLAKNKTIWDLQLSIPLNSGNIGIEFDGTYFYITRIFSDQIYQLDLAGNLVQQFSVPGVSGLLDLAYDGTYMYGGSGTNEIYIMDFSSQTLIGSIISPTNSVRHIAYDANYDAFYVGNWNSDIALIDRSGNVLNTIPAYSNGLSLQGSAFDNYSPGGPYLWVFDQGNGLGNPQYIHQIDINTGLLTGVQHDVTTDFPNSNGIAGGLFAASGISPGTITLGGILRDTTDVLFGYELTDAPLHWIALDHTTGTVLPYDSNEVKIYWHPEYEELWEAYIGIYTNNPIQPFAGNIYLSLIILTSGINDSKGLKPENYALHQNYPNPFNPTTTIKYNLKENSFVNISIYNILGEKVRTLINQSESAGFNSVLWDGLNDAGEQVSTGVYIYKLEIAASSLNSSNEYIKSRKMIYIK